MDWGVFWTALLTSIGGMTVLAAVLGWLGKKWIGARIENSVRHEYDVKLETHKATLQQEVTEAVRKLETEFRDAVDRQAADKDLFRRFLATLPSSGSIAFLRDNNFAGFSFRRSRLKDLDAFYHDWDDAEHEFLDNELEEKRKHLHSLISEFTGYLALNTWPLDTDANSSWVPPDWEHEQPDRFRETVDRIHSLAQRIVDAHSSLVRMGREKLKVTVSDLSGRDGSDEKEPA